MPDASGDAVGLEEELSDEEKEEDIEAMDRSLRDMDEDDQAGQREFVSDDDASDEDLEDLYGSDEESDEEESGSEEDERRAPSKRPRARPGRQEKRRPGKRGRPGLEIEYERETAPLTAEQAAQW